MIQPLRVALIVKGSPASLERSSRNMGYWSYPVPEFIWDHHVLGDQTLARNRFSGYDLICVEDAGTHGSLVGDGPPVIYLAIDSTLSAEHRQARQRHASYADLVLVDHDGLGTFLSVNPHVRRLAYCVNDGVFKPELARTIDVCYHCGSGESRGMPGGRERNEIRAILGEHCRKRGYSFVSGGVGLPEYARHMGQARVVVNWPRTSTNRPHRVFDAMAAGAALLTGPLPPVDEDYRRAGEHYREFVARDEMLDLLDEMVADSSEIAAAGRALVMGRHTWAIRAHELRQMLREELGL